MKQFIGTCVSPPWHYRLFEMIIEESDEISKDAFLYTCEVDEELRESIEEYPHDYGFYRSRHRGVYFFTHSMIEHFYQ